MFWKENPNCIYTSFGLHNGSMDPVATLNKCENDFANKV